MQAFLPSLVQCRQHKEKRIWELGKSEQSKLITAVILAVVGVICGMVPYFAAAKVITLLLAGERAVSAYTVWLTAALCDYLLRTVLYNGALSISHKATFSILKTIRQMLLAKLIAGFWDVKVGTIRMGGYGLKDIPLTELYEQVAFVSQENYLFDDTVRETIRMGNQTATHAAGCDSFIGKLEHGFDTMVGGGGAHLSGGERQRIAIVCAMLKNAPMIVPDEATAYIDPENEAVIQRAVAKLVSDKTVIVIVHRLSTIIGADNIVVMQDGRIAAQGKHEELLESSRLYREMWQAHMGAKDGEAA